MLNFCKMALFIIDSNIVALIFIIFNGHLPILQGVPENMRLTDIVTFYTPRVLSNKQGRRQRIK